MLWVKGQALLWVAVLSLLTSTRSLLTNHVFQPTALRTALRATRSKAAGVKPSESFTHSVSHEPPAPLLADTSEGGMWAQGEVCFTVFGEPLTLARHRSTRAGIVYNPSQKLQQAFLLCCAQHLPPEPLAGPLEMRLVFFFGRPKNHYGTGRNAGVLKSGVDVWHMKRKDLDNLVKFVLDALNGHAYLDDAQVSMISTAKLYCAAPATPGSGGGSGNGGNGGSAGADSGGADKGPAQKTDFLGPRVEVSIRQLSGRDPLFGLQFLTPVPARPPHPQQ